MTTYAWNVPGYIQGHRFSDDPRYWTTSSGRFRDLAGYDALNNYVQLVAGTPIFETLGANSRRGLKLNQSNIYKFHSSVSWEGSFLIVARAHTGSGSLTLYPWTFGTADPPYVNGTIRLNKSGGLNTFNAATPSALMTSPLGSIANDAIVICAYSFNQADRIARRTRDGVTIDTNGPAAGTNGNHLAIGGNTAPGVVADIGGISHDYVRLGDNFGDGSLTPNTLDWLHVFEQHFWKGDVLLNNASALADFITHLKDYYGV